MYDSIEVNVFFKKRANPSVVVSDVGLPSMIRFSKETHSSMALLHSSLQPFVSGPLIREQSGIVFNQQTVFRPCHFEFNALLIFQLKGYEIVRIHVGIVSAGGVRPFADHSGFTSYDRGGIIFIPLGNSFQDGDHDEQNNSSGKQDEPPGWPKEITMKKQTIY